MTMSSFNKLAPEKLGSTRNEENSTCPVCNKDFNVFEIEKHVNRCLFLSAENKPEVKATPNKHNIQKRGPAEIDSLWNSKKVKEDASGNVNLTLMGSSSSNISVSKILFFVGWKPTFNDF